MVLCDEPSLTVSLADTGYHLIMTITVIIVKIITHVNTFFKLNLKDIVTGQDPLHYRIQGNFRIALFFTNFAQLRN